LLVWFEEVDTCPFSWRNRIRFFFLTVIGSCSGAWPEWGNKFNDEFIKYESFVSQGKTGPGRRARISFTFLKRTERDVEMMASISATDSVSQSIVPFFGLTRKERALRGKHAGLSSALEQIPANN